MKHSEGKLDVVYTGGVALGAGFAEDTGKTAIHCFRMICNTVDKKHQDYHVPKINANAQHLVKCWNAFNKGGLVDKLISKLEKIKIFADGDEEGENIDAIKNIVEMAFFDIESEV